MEGGEVLRVSKETSDVDYKYNSKLGRSDTRQETSDKSNPKLNNTVTGCCMTILQACGLVILLGVFLATLTATVVVWGTTFVEDSIIRELVIKNNTRTYDWWVNPPLKPMFNVRIFNYTNVDRFMSGDDDKLQVEEVGPYVYRETFQRVNVLFYENGTVSYQEKRSFKYMPELSNGQMTDMLTVPNMAFLGAASIMKDKYYIARIGMSAMFRSMKATPFVTHDAESLFWGYEDKLFTIGKSFMALQGHKDDPHNKKIGLLIARNGTSSTRIAIHTGVDDITQLGVIDTIAGKDHLSFWNTAECNRIDGTDGSMYPPCLINEEARLYMYMKDMCRKFPMVFKEYVQVHHGMTAMRFHPPRDVFASRDTNPENGCFCHEHASSCPPAGVFNSSPCSFNAPIMMSFPHFYLGDPVLLDAVDGLKPDPKKHNMFIDLHPKFGFPLGGESRFQVNIMVRKSVGIGYLEQFKDETILPIAWFEVVVDQLPPDVQQVLMDLTFATHTSKLIILYFFLATLLIVCIVAGKYAYTHHYSRHVENRNAIYKQGTILATRKDNH